MTLAARQRARFEGWPKLELAAKIQADRATTSVRVESRYDEDKRGWADIAFTTATGKFFLELKTPGSNRKIPGVEDKHKAITHAIAGVIADANQLKKYPGTGLVAFVLFPLPEGDDQWIEYLRRISEQTGIRLSEDEHCSPVRLELDLNQYCKAIVCCFSVTKSTL
jgi:hypothetical protein